MISIFFPFAHFVLSFCILLLSISPLFGSDKILKLGVYAFRTPAEMEQRFRPLAKYLSDNLEGYDVTLRVLSPREMEHAIEKNELDLVLTNPVHYIELSQKFQMTGAIATMVPLEGGLPSYKLGGTIFALKSSGFHGDLKELQGERFAVFGPHSLGGYLASLYEFKKEGMDYNAIGKIISTSKSHDDVVKTVMEGRADVGFIRSGVLESMEKKGLIDLRKIQILHPQHHQGFNVATSTEAYPEWPFVAMPQVESDAARRLSSLLLGIEPNDPVARQAKIYGFSVPADYKPVEQMMRELEVFPFDKHQPLTLMRVWREYSWQISSVLLFTLMGILFTLRLNRINERLFKEEFELKKVNISLQEFQDALEKERAFVQGILDSVENIVMIARAGAVFQFNSRFYETFAYDNLDSFLKNHSSICELFIAKEGFLSTENEMEQWFSSVVDAPDQLHKVAMKDRHGEEKIFSVKIRELLFDKVKYMIVTFNDITLIEEARRSAEESQRAKAEFLATMSHEIRTPMNGILGFTSLLAQTALTSTQQKYLDIVSASTNTLLGVVNDILDFSKIESGRLELDPVVVDLKQEMLLHFSFYEPIASQKEIEYTLNLPENIPVCVSIDMLRLKQVLSNLIGNALKFTPNKGSVSFGLTLIRQTNESADIRFFITDTGIGISLEKQQKIFEAFGQADSSTTREYGGTGLGLSISAQLVELFGSQLEVHSILGQGSTFYFTLSVPLCDSHSLTLSHEPSILLPSDSIKNYGSLSVLVAEDHEVNRLLMRTLLEEAGVTFDFAENGEIAIAMAQKHPYDIIFMDVNMPIMDGIKATVFLRKMGVKTPIIALTANVMDGDREYFINVGMDDYLSKPIDFNAFNQLLSRYSLPNAKIEVANKIQNDEENPTALLISELNLDKEVVSRLFALFEESMVREIANLTQAIQNKNYFEIGKVAHKISGAAASLYLHPIHKIAQVIENMGMSKEEEGDYDSLLVELKLEIQHHLARVKGGK
ncbi:MAG: PhnD/SsuA/transferrin family substrate-binding protein [Campylobacterales bacterium]|nr:PhnD/SsuA/transferrin family substrate-binding protein [Campylobacterales bacterium]